MADTPDTSDIPDAPEPPPPPAPVKKKRNKVLMVLLALLLIPAVIVALWIWVTLGYTYAVGERAGYVQKISKKGWLCKTWEGELAMVSMPGTNPEKFFFTVRDDNVAEHINQSLGQRVALSYQQHKGVPTTCFGETDYFVVAVKVLPQ